VLPRRQAGLCNDPDFQGVEMLRREAEREEWGRCQGGRQAYVTIPIFEKGNPHI